jgi:hypothetical protein
MLLDFIWKAFEETGDMAYYLEYIKYRDIYKRQRMDGDRDRMDKTG